MGNFGGPSSHTTHHLFFSKWQMEKKNISWRLAQAISQGPLNRLKFLVQQKYRRNLEWPVSLQTLYHEWPLFLIYILRHVVFTPAVLNAACINKRMSIALRRSTTRVLQTAACSPAGATIEPAGTTELGGVRHAWCSVITRYKLLSFVEVWRPEVPLGVPEDFQRNIWATSVFLVHGGIQ